MSSHVDGVIHKHDRAPCIPLVHQRPVDYVARAPSDDLVHIFDVFKALRSFRGDSARFIPNASFGEACREFSQYLNARVATRCLSKLPFRRANIRAHLFEVSHYSREILALKLLLIFPDGGNVRISEVVVDIFAVREHIIIDWNWGFLVQ